MLTREGHLSRFLEDHGVLTRRGTHVVFLGDHGVLKREGRVGNPQTPASTSVCCISCIARPPGVLVWGVDAAAPTRRAHHPTRRVARITPVRAMFSWRPVRAPNNASRHKFLPCT
jgi:hypothetical protein